MTENEADIISAINPDALAYYQAMVELLAGKMQDQKVWNMSYFETIIKKK